MRAQGRLRPILLAALLCAAASAADADEPQVRSSAALPTLRIDPTGISVSGVSSGGYQAAQLQVAYSATFSGAGVIAAGPYFCAGTGYAWNLWRALNVCSDADDYVPFTGPPLLEPSLQAVQDFAAKGRIDDPANLRRARVYLFSGRLDTTVPPPVVGVATAFHQALAGDPRQVVFEARIDAAHAMVTETFGKACDVSAPPYLVDCDFDLAGALLEHIYGPLQPKSPTTREPIPFDQRPFVAAGRTAGMADTGYVYVPERCAEGAVCRLHVALHGCQQSASQIGDIFYRHAGYNAWAEANDIVVLYPQTVPMTTSWFGATLPWPNPKACWDWWGYTGPDFANKQGAQPQAIKAMIDAIAAR